MKLPVNLAYYWKTLLAVPGQESGFTDAGNKLFNDLFYDITNYYANLDLLSCNFNEKHLYRIVTFRWYPGFNDLKTYQKTYLEDNGFVIPDDPFLGTFKANTDGKHIAALADSLYDPSFHLKNELSYRIKDYEIYLKFNIVDSEHSPQRISEKFVTPWGDTLDIFSVNLIASEIALEQSPFWDNFASLVYHKQIEDTETEIEYRQKILGLTYMSYRGLTSKSLNTTVNVVLGLPVLLHSNEEIMHIEADKLTTDKDTYDLDPLLGPLKSNIQVGHKYEKFTALYDIIRVEDAVNSPNWADQVRLPRWMYQSSYGYHEKMDLSREISLEYQAPGYEGENEIRFDTPGMEPFMDPEDPRELKVKSVTYYLWHAQLKNSICRILVDLSKIGSSNFADISVIDSVLPIWTAYMTTGELEVSDELVPLVYEETLDLSVIWLDSSMHFGSEGDIIEAASGPNVEGVIEHIQYNRVVYKPTVGSFLVGDDIQIRDKEHINGNITELQTRFDHGSVEERGGLGVILGSPNVRTDHVSHVDMQGFSPEFYNEDTVVPVAGANNFPPTTFGAQMIDPYLSEAGTGFAFKDHPSWLDGGIILASDGRLLGPKTAIVGTSLLTPAAVDTMTLQVELSGSPIDQTIVFEDGSDILSVRIMDTSVRVERSFTGEVNTFAIPDISPNNLEVCLDVYVNESSGFIEWRVQSFNGGVRTSIGTYTTGGTEDPLNFYSVMGVLTSTNSVEKIWVNGTAIRGEF